MSDDDLHQAFELAYVDFCNAGAHRFDPLVLAALWAAFLADAATGFRSLFEPRQ